jgi:hypothetical protein
MVKPYKIKKFKEFNRYGNTQTLIPTIKKWKPGLPTVYPMWIAEKYKKALDPISRQMIEEVEKYAKDFVAFHAMRQVNFHKDAKDNNAETEKKDKQKEAKKQARAEKEAEIERKKIERKNEISKLIEKTNKSFESLSGFQGAYGFDDLRKKYDAIFDSHSKPLATTIISNIDNESKKKAGAGVPNVFQNMNIENVVKGEGLEQDVNQMVDNNINLIKSIPQQYFEDVLKVTNDALFKNVGKGPYEIQQNLQQFSKDIAPISGSVQKRILFISRNETRKNYSTLNTIRQKKLGLKRFIWHHTGAGHTPRKSHMAMSGKEFSYDDPPVIDERTGERGFPGQTYNCHCFAQPIIPDI